MNFEFFFKDLDKLPETIVVVMISYTILILYTRIFGLKSYSKMSSYDFVHTLAVASLLAATISTGKPSLVVRVLAVGLLYLLKTILASLRKWSPFIENVTSNDPIYLMRDGKVLHENLKKTKVSEDELRGKLREANVFKLANVKAVIFETTGDVSVLHSAGDSNMELDEYIVSNVC